MDGSLPEVLDESEVGLHSAPSGFERRCWHHMCRLRMRDGRLPVCSANLGKRPVVRTGLRVGADIKRCHASRADRSQLIDDAPRISRA